MDRTPPPYDEALDVDFCDFMTLNQTLEEMYGPRGGRALALRAGRASFKAAIQQVGASIGLTAEAIQALPPSARVRQLLQFLAQGTTAHQKGVTIEVKEEGDRLIYEVQQCSACWGRTGADHCICHGTVGFLQEALEWAGVGDLYHVEERTCSAMQPQPTGSCQFAIYQD